MNLKGHLTVAGITTILIVDHLSGLNEIYKYYQNFINFNIQISNIQIILILLFLLIGNIFPDLDQLYGKLLNKKNNIHYTKYHRQFTHSLSLFSISLIISLYYFLQNNNIYILYFIFFNLGILEHIIIDIFFGKGGIPLFLSTKSWNSKYRISIPLFDNEGLTTNFLIFLTFLGNVFLTYKLFITNNNFLYLYLSFLIYYYYIYNKITNSKNIFLINMIVISFIFLYDKYFFIIINNIK